MNGARILIAEDDSELDDRAATRGRVDPDDLVDLEGAAAAEEKQGAADRYGRRVMTGAGEQTDQGRTASPQRLDGVDRRRRAL